MAATLKTPRHKNFNSFITVIGFSTATHPPHLHQHKWAHIPEPYWLCHCAASAPTMTLHKASGIRNRILKSCSLTDLLRKNLEPPRNVGILESFALLPSRNLVFLGIYCKCYLKEKKNVATKLEEVRQGHQAPLSKAIGGSWVQPMWRQIDCTVDGWYQAKPFHETRVLRNSSDVSFKTCGSSKENHIKWKSNRERERSWSPLNHNVDNLPKSFI